MKNSKKENAPEVPVQEQLNEKVENLTLNELECIARHLKQFIYTDWFKKENLPNECEGCSIHCSNDEHGLNPWTAFFKLFNLTNTPFMVGREQANKQDND